MTISHAKERVTGRFAVAALLSVSVVLVLACTRRIWCVDFWWQYATGEYIVLHGFPKLDSFSYTSASHVWIELRWLYCLALYFTVNSLGFSAAVLLKTLCIASAFALVSAAVFTKKATLATVTVLMVSVLASSQRFFLRPEIVTFFFMALFIFMIAASRDGRIPKKCLFLLPLLQIVWTNSHTLFILGPLLMGLYFTVTAAPWFFARHTKKSKECDKGRLSLQLGIICLLTILACLLNPYGLDGALFPFTLFQEISGTGLKQVIGEFHGPFAFQTPFTALVYYKWLVFLCLGSMVANWRRLDAFWTLLAISQFYLSNLSIRNLPLFGLVAIPLFVFNVNSVLVNNSAGLKWPWMVRSRLLMQQLYAIVIISACFWYMRELTTDRFYVRQGDTNQFGLGLASHRYPQNAVSFVTENGIQGPIFHSMADGSYLTARHQKVFFDPRLEVYGERRVIEFVGLFNDPDAWRRAAEHYGFSVLLLNLNTGMLDEVLNDSAWRLVYFDEIDAVFLHQTVRSDIQALTGDQIAQLADQLRSKLPAVKALDRLRLMERSYSPTVHIRLGQFLLALGRPLEAVSFLTDAAETQPNNQLYALSLATALNQSGDITSAIKRYRVLADQETPYSQVYFELAALYVKQGEISQGRDVLDRALILEPDHAHGWALLGKLSYRLGDMARSVEGYQHAYELDSQNTVYSKNLARVLVKTKRSAEAKKILELALQLNQVDGSLYSDLAIVYLSENDISQARFYVEMGLEKDPGNVLLSQLSHQIEEVELGNTQVP